MTEWAAMLRFAVRECHLRPADFWRLSWREWLWLTVPPSAPILSPPALPRDVFETMKKAFPDD
ncbi:MAG: phage tail assembly chaperone [Asticcacaulis sp.]|uniref:phage tail assembly chaperone n=1 Tax=Asticcacaulis sp. TaxID=1872648 RepID=UPI0025C725F8|nr:phage tail assembly chaperone [Asticcacaulis sp.]MCA1935193.1 phage tail assembly chaperone [Asticcacaulis sp.]